MQIKNSISLRLLKKVFVIYFSITFIITALQIIIEYNDTKNTIQNDLISLEPIYINTLRNAIWDMNIEQIDSLSDSISKLPFVKEVTLEDASGNMLSHKKEPRIINPFSHQFNIYHEYESKKILIATVTFSSDQNSVISIVKTGIILIILNALIKSFILTLLFIGVFRKYLTEPLTQLASQIDNINFDTLGHYRLNVNVPINSELDLLQKKFNLMQDNLQHQKYTLLEVKQQYTDQLEQEVKERTKELEKLNIELMQMATTDYLTKVRNRRSFYDIGNQYFAMAKRNEKELSIISFDIDHFKTVNDTYGHQAGDEVLIKFASECKRLLRESDVFARIGGEEFAVVLFDTSHDNSIHLAQKIVYNTSEIRVNFGAKSLSFTVSAGVAFLQLDDQSIDEVVGRADQALYQAKENGRNQTVY